MTRSLGKRIAGSVLLLAVPVALITLLATPGVRAPLARTTATISSGWFGSEAGDLRLPVATTEHVEPGLPVFLAARPGGLEPVAWVTAVEDGHLRIRFAPDQDTEGPWRLLALPAARGLGDAWEIAVPEETAAELGRELESRIERLIHQAVLPELKSRFPAFLERVDPRKDPRAREVLDAVGQEVMDRLRPFVKDLARRVTKDLKKHFDFLDRVGLLWKVVRGDSGGLERKLLPVAEKSVESWWEENRDAVLSAVGEGIAARSDDLQAWIVEDVWDAAREELAEPLLENRREELEEEAEDAIGAFLAAVVRAPHGGFRTRFAAVLRSRLLEKDEPLLLLERAP